MQSIRAQVLSSSPVRKSARARDQKSQGVQGSFKNARDLSNQVHDWYMAARHHLAEAHHCDQQIVRLQGRMETLEKTVGRASPIMLGVGAPLLGFGEAIHVGVVSHGAWGLLAAGVAGALAWVGGVAGTKRRIAQLSSRCADAQDQTQNYTRMAEAMDPDRSGLLARPAPVLLRALQVPRSK